MAATSPTVAVASGKGGTGKTTVAVNLAAWIARSGRAVTLADCDVEAPNAHLFLPVTEPDVEEVRVPLVEVGGKCTACGACRDACAFGAVRILGHEVTIFPELCRGCGACVLVCDSEALVETERRVGEVRSGTVDPQVVGTGRVGSVTLVSGVMDVGDVRAPDVIRHARSIARATPSDATILDAPPGVACAAVAAVRDADYLLLVTEPTLFGAHDLELTLRLGRELGLPMGVVVNRADSGTADIRSIAAEHGADVLAEIPFDRAVAEKYARGGLLLDHGSGAEEWLDAVWRAVGAPAGSGTGSGA